MASLNNCVAQRIGPLEKIHTRLNKYGDEGLLQNILYMYISYLLLITFANSLDPDQDRQNVGHDLDPNV